MNRVFTLEQFPWNTVMGMIHSPPDIRLLLRNEVTAILVARPLNLE
jgi:hypothetical protein